MTQNDHPFAVLQILIAKGVTEERLNAHEREEIRRDECPLDLLWLLAGQGNYRPASLVEDGQILEGMCLTAPFEKVAITCAAIGNSPTAGARVRNPEHRQLFRVLIGERTKEY